MTVSEAARVLAAAGVPSPDHDARALACHVLGVRWAHGLDARDLGADYDALVEKRAARVPLQHLVGTTGFRHLEIAV